MQPESPPQPLHTAIADPRESPWYPYDNASGHFDANLAMILIFLFCALICALALNAVIRFLLRRSSGSSSNTANPTAEASEKPPNAASAAVASPPTMVYSAGMKLAGAAAECAICLCEFVDGEGVRVLPRCKHGFHVKCIEDWLNSAHFSCPTCRSSCLVTATTATEEVVLHIEDPVPVPTSDQSSTPATTTSTSSTTATTEQLQRRSHEAERTAV
ncbi:hypothetical protein Sjap_005853 [Stephania japonica]|uniref:RING-type domain-containing protein n=1 Tax=Stephania japonica TaxID=461633 RepID=A0AAP0K7B7_9MAGN